MTEQLKTLIPAALAPLPRPKPLRRAEPSPDPFDDVWEAYEREKEAIVEMGLDALAYEDAIAQLVGRLGL